MTCIVGLEHDGKVFIGGDAAGDSDGDIRTFDSPKVFKKATLTRGTSMLIGYAGSFRIGQVIEHTFEPPPIPGSINPMTYLVTTFVDALRQVFQDKGVHATSDEDGDDRGEHLLIGFYGRIYFMDVDFHVMHPILPFYALGAGGNAALGALYSTRRMPPEKRCLNALKASAEFCSTVRPPFTVLSL
jgi:ATP-dependent protease HslVU (ClpYQ) peptidase subunit